jgi:hypothetical protein
MILAGETLKQILWMKFLTVKLHGGIRAMLVVQWGFPYTNYAQWKHLVLTSYIYVEKKAAAIEQVALHKYIYIYIYYVYLSIYLYI